MIIKATFNDNDFKEMLETFFEHFEYNNLNYHLNKLVEVETEQGIREYCKLAKEIDLFLHLISDGKKLTIEQEKRFIEIIKESFVDYIKDNSLDHSEYLCDELEITIQESVTDHWENGESLYYFPMHDIYIVM